MSDAADIVCVSHLWWDWVWQRPQQIMSRLARAHRVLWVEEPHLEIGPESDDLEIRRGPANLEIAALIYRSDAETFWTRLNESTDRMGAPRVARSPEVVDASLGFVSPAQTRLKREVGQYVAGWRRAPLVLWLYTPLAVDFIDELCPELVVYDVMDELSAFKFAPSRIKGMERELLSRADIVFCGGPSLYEARKSAHPSVYLFPSGVEQGHFARALDAELSVPESMSHLTHPIIGFFGVIDERMDLGLLARIAEMRPDWSFVMVGPVLKITKDDLPRRPNIHYLGKQDYQVLPAFLKAFDVATIPFALDESTRFLSPTKTLEYMAAHKPVVSTPIPDVVSLYGDVVRVASTPVEFVSQIESALTEGEQEREARVMREDELLTQHDWDWISTRMDALVRDALQRKIAKGTLRASSRSS